MKEKKMKEEEIVKLWKKCNGIEDLINASKRIAYREVFDAVFSLYWDSGVELNSKSLDELKKRFLK